MCLSPINEGLRWATCAKLIRPTLIVFFSSIFQTCILTIVKAEDLLVDEVEVEELARGGAGALLAGGGLRK